LKRIIYSILFLFLIQPAFAAGPDTLSDYTNSGKTMHYIRDGGSGDGSAWNNALDDLPATFVRDHIYFVAGGSYGTHTFNTAASGTDCIYIVFATEDDHGTDTGWSDTYDDTVAHFSSTGLVWTVSTSYWVFDGAKGRGPTTWDGSNPDDWIGTDYGLWVEKTTLGNAHVAHMGSGVDSVTWNMVEFESKTDRGMGDVNRGGCLYARFGDNDDVTVSYCFFHETNYYAALIMGSAGSTENGWVIEYNYFYDNWKKQTISFRYGQQSEMDVRYNVFHNCNGNGIVKMGDDIGGQVTNNIRVYGNLFFMSDSSYNEYQDRTVGTWGGKTDQTVDYIYVYNNTFINMPNLAFGQENSGRNFYVYNNIFSSAPAFEQIDNDYNAYIGTSGSEANDQDNLSTDVFVDWAGVITGNDNNDFLLISATNAGDSTIGATYNADLNGDTRGGDGTWDRGYDEYGPGNTPTLTGCSVTGGTL